MRKKKPQIPRFSFQDNGKRKKKKISEHREEERLSGGHYEVIFMWNALVTLGSVSTKLNTPNATVKTTNTTLFPNKTSCLKAQQRGQELNEPGK